MSTKLNCCEFDIVLFQTSIAVVRISNNNLQIKFYFPSQSFLNPCGFSRYSSTLCIGSRFLFDLILVKISFSSLEDNEATSSIHSERTGALSNLVSDCNNQLPLIYNFLGTYHFQLKQIFSHCFRYSLHVLFSMKLDQNKSLIFLLSTVFT